MVSKSAGTKLLIATVIGGGAAAVASVMLAFPSFEARELIPRAIMLAALTAFCELVSIRLVHGSQSELITLTEIAVIGDVVLLPPAAAVITALVGLSIALAIQRRVWVKALFNLGQYSLGIVICAAVYHGLAHEQFSGAIGLAALTAGAIAFTGLNLVTISAILAATQDRRFADVIKEEAPLSLAVGIGCSSVGIVAVAAYLWRPLLLPFVLAPTLGLHLATRGWVKQKSFSNEINEEKTKLERIVAHSSEGIVLADRDGSVALWSPSMHRITGISSEEAIGKHLSFLLRGRGPLGQALSIEVDANAEPFELELITPDGQVKWLHGLHGPGTASDGTLAFDVILVTDVTRQREVDRLKSDFISTVSHELRTPLTPIKGFASLLLRRSDELSPERKREALTTIIERTDHLGRLVEDLLLAATMSREGERRLPEVDRRSIDASVLIEKVLAPFRRSHPHRAFVVSQDDSLTILADPLRAEQMISHIVSNAIKFSEEATPVTVAVSREDSSARIDVTDEGRGIPADKLEEIFERFKRIEDPLRMETGGAGLGLFVARQLARAMDATVTVSSRLGEGSTFTLRIPLVASAGAQSSADEALAG
ncbi:MAG: sensor histidine kinase [Actinomycetota bacterium]